MATVAIKNSVSGGVLLICGTCIGAGMLGLPVMTAAAGFYPTLLAFLIAWFFMTCAALVYLEVSLRLPGETNLSTIAGLTLGRAPKIGAGLICVLLMYALISAYTSGGTTLAAQILGLDLKSNLQMQMFTLLFVVLFALPVYLGTRWFDRLNRMLMAGFITTFLMLCFLGFKTRPAIEFNSFGQTKYLWFTFTLIVTAFGYHTLIPTLKTYLNEDIKKLRRAIIVGSLLPLLVYVVWQLLVMHLVPTWGEAGLVDMLNSQANPSDALATALGQYGTGILWAQTWFAFFILTTCFMGLGLAIGDFFADAFHISKDGRARRLGLCLLAFAPPTIYTMFNPQGFMLALKYAGIFAAILLIIFPTTMAWSARYVKKLPGNYEMAGGKLLLILTMAFGVFVVFAEVAQQLGVFPIPHN